MSVVDRPSPLRSRLTPMVAYQFMFYTLYQFFRKRAQEGESAWKAGAVIGVMEIWFGVATLMILNLARGGSYWPPRWLCAAFVVLLAVLTYGTFNWNDRWKQYATAFRDWSPRRLLVGRILVVGIFIALAIGSYVLAWRVSLGSPHRPANTAGSGSPVPPIQ